MRRDTDWFTSSYSAAASNACVEVRITGTHIDVRDSKNRTAGTLTFDGTVWNAFLAAVPRRDGGRSVR